MSDRKTVRWKRTAGTGSRIAKKIDYPPLVAAFPRPITDSLYAGLLQEFIKFLLYTRQVIPTPYVQLLESTRKKLDGGVPFRKRSRLLRQRKAVDTFEAVLNALPTFCATHQVVDACIMFGAAVLSPKEVYFFRRSSPPECNTLFDGDIIAGACRRLIRALLPAEAALPNSSIGRKKIFVLLKVRRPVAVEPVAMLISPSLGTSVGMEDSNDAKQSQGEEEDIQGMFAGDLIAVASSASQQVMMMNLSSTTPPVPGSAPLGFIPKPTLRVRQDQARFTFVAYCTGPCLAEITVESLPIPAPTHFWGDDEKNHIWFQYQVPCGSISAK